jgi:hypothetical protein
MSNIASEGSPDHVFETYASRRERNAAKRAAAIASERAKLMATYQRLRLPIPPALLLPAPAPDDAPPTFLPFSIGAGWCQALSDCSIDSVLMSLAGASLLFGIGTWALP